MVFPHRACGFAAGAAPIPVYGWDFFTEKVSPHRACGSAAGAAPIPVYGWDFFTEKVSPRHDWEVTRQSNGRGTRPTLLR